MTELSLPRTKGSLFKSPHPSIASLLPFEDGPKECSDDGMPTGKLCSDAKLLKALEERERELINSICIHKNLLPAFYHAEVDTLVKSTIKETREALIALQDRICTYSWQAMEWGECNSHCPGKRDREVHVCFDMSSFWMFPHICLQCVADWVSSTEFLESKRSDDYCCAKQKPPISDSELCGPSYEWEQVIFPSNCCEDIKWVCYECGSAVDDDYCNHLSKPTYCKCRWSDFYELVLTSSQLHSSGNSIFSKILTFGIMFMLITSIFSCIFGK